MLVSLLLMINNSGMNGETLISMLQNKVMVEHLLIDLGPLIRNEQDT